MKLHSLVLFLMLAGSLAVRAVIPAGWSTNYAATVSSAASAQRPVLVYFTASWCGPCKLMSHITLTDPAIREIITNLEYVAVDIDEQPELASQLGVKAVPTFIMLSNTNNEVERVTGFRVSEDFLPWLTNSIAEAKEVLVRQTLIKKELAEVDELLTATTTNSTQEALAILYHLCDERDRTVVQAAVTRLKVIATRDPAALLEGLNDPRLATRIQVANLLRLTIGERFDFDPWSDVASRQKGILAWRKIIFENSQFR